MSRGEAIDLHGLSAQVAAAPCRCYQRVTSSRRLIQTTQTAFRLRTLAVAALACAVAVVLGFPGVATSSAAANDRWTETGHSNVPLDYWQGITSGPQGDLFFAGVYNGLYRTSSELVETGRTQHAIPWALQKSSGYNHIGDISWDASEGGRLLLPLACQHPKAGQDPNTCHTAGIGVADPVALTLRYYVQLDPADIDTIAWNEVSPDGRFVWTTTRKDLVAYSTGDIAAANAAPGGPRIRPAIRLADAKPPIGTTGAAFLGDRLLLSGKSTLDGSLQIWAVDLVTGAKRMELRRELAGESEGIDVVDALGGDLHWEIFPHTQGGAAPTYGAGHGVVLHFRARAGMSSACSFLKRGTVGDDLLMGTQDGDKDSGSDGHDRMYGLAGDDCLLGGEGDDLLWGGAGADRLFGDDGRDELRGNAGTDRAFGGNGADVLLGGVGADRLFGSEGNDALTGGRGRDKLIGGSGADILRGGSGRDWLFAGPGADRAEGGRGADVLAGGDGADRMAGGAGRDKIMGGAGNDTIDARDGERDVVLCGPGRDRVRADAADRQVSCE